MKLLELYSDYFANWLSGGNLIPRDKISLLGLKPLFDRFLTNGYITKIWIVDRIPVYCNSAVTQAIRQEMFQLCPNVRTVVHMYNVPVKPNVTSDVFKRHLKKCASAYNQYKEVFDSLTEEQQLLGVQESNSSGQKISIDQESLMQIKKMYDSYTYVYKQATHGKQFTHTYFFVQASAKTKRDMRDYQKHLANFFDGSEIHYHVVKGNIGQYLANYCPGTFMQEEVKGFNPMLFSQENLATLTPYRTKGLVGDKGVLMGVDAQTKLPYWMDFKSSGAAQVVMWLGKSGCGKTFTAFPCAINLIGDSTHISVIDIKGNEWDKLAKYVNTKVIAMDGMKPRFVNTMRLDDLGCTKEDCIDAYNTAVRDTVTLLSLMVNLQPNEGNPHDLEAILEQAVAKMYSKREVYKDNPSTFSRTAGMKYAEILDIVDTLSSTHSYTENQKKLCLLIKTRCANFFLSEGRYSDSFKNEISVGEILNAEAVIYSFNKNSQAMLDTLDTIRVFMVQALDGRKTTIRKRQKLHTAAFYEELQRCDQFGTLLSYISHRVTGSRSDNLTIFMLLNAVNTFNNDQLSAVRSNITTKIVGLVEESDIPILVNDFGCGEIETYLNLINGNKQENWRNCFAVLNDNGLKKDKAIFKAVLPKEMTEHLRTRDVIE